MNDYNPLFEIVAFLAVFAALATGANTLWRTYKNVGEAEVEAAWEVRLHNLALQIVRIGPQTVPKATASDSAEPLYLTIFPDPNFRSLIERYVVEVDRKRTSFTPRIPRPAQLRDPALRATVARAETLMEDFYQKYPGVAQSYRS